MLTVYEKYPSFHWNSVLPQSFHWNSGNVQMFLRGHTYFPLEAYMCLCMLHMVWIHRYVHRHTHINVCTPFYAQDKHVLDGNLLWKDLKDVRNKETLFCWLSGNSYHCRVVRKPQESDWSCILFFKYKFVDSRVLFSIIILWLQSHVWILKMFCIVSDIQTSLP